MKSFSRVWLFVTLWTIACCAPPAMGFSRQEYWSGLPFSSPGVLPNPWTEPGSPAFQADSLRSEPPGKPHTLVRNINRYNTKEKQFENIFQNFRKHMSLTLSIPWIFVIDIHKQNGLFSRLFIYYLLYQQNSGLNDDSSMHQAVIKTIWNHFTNGQENTSKIQW